MDGWICTRPLLWIRESPSVFPASDFGLYRDTHAPGWFTKPDCCYPRTQWRLEILCERFGLVSRRREMEIQPSLWKLWLAHPSKKNLEKDGLPLLLMSVLPFGIRATTVQSFFWIRIGKATKRKSKRSSAMPVRSSLFRFAVIEWRISIVQPVWQCIHLPTQQMFYPSNRLPMDGMSRCRLQERIKSDACMLFPVKNRPLTWKEPASIRCLSLIK